MDKKPQQIDFKKTSERLKNRQMTQLATTSQRSDCGGQQSTGIVSRRLKRFWERLGEIYGAKAVEREYGKLTVENWECAQWAKTLSNLSDEQIKRGLDLLIADPIDYVVNRKKFYRLATLPRPPAHKPYRPALPKSTHAERQAAAKIHLQAAKQMLQGV